jgi:peptidoglycan hydrolase CwlO-like protein
MEDKMSELMEKIYSEFSTFKTDVTNELKGIRRDLNSVKEDVKSLNVKVDKTTLGLEGINSEIGILAEVQQNMIGQNEKQIPEAIEPICEDISVIKCAVKKISNDL